MELFEKQEDGSLKPLDSDVPAWLLRRYKIYKWLRNKNLGLDEIVTLLNLTIPNDQGV